MSALSSYLMVPMEAQAHIITSNHWLLPKYYEAIIDYYGQKDTGDSKNKDYTFLYSNIRTLKQLDLCQ
jgi:hypothetical protein